MLENRPIVAITVGYIIGIIMGLYCKISIVFLYLIIFLIHQLLKISHTKKFKLISFRRYFRYVKIIITKKVFIVILIFSILSNTVVLYKSFSYDKLQKNLDGKEIQINASVLSNATNKKFKKTYIVKVKSSIAKNKKMYLNVNNKDKKDLQYGDVIQITGIFKKPQTRKNYKAYDYSEYLRTKGICGVLEGKNIENCGKAEKTRQFTF